MPSLTSKIHLPITNKRQKMPKPTINELANQWLEVDVVSYVTGKV